MKKIRNKFASFTSSLRFSKRDLFLILLTAIVSIASVTAAAMMLSKLGNYTIPSIGTIKTIGVEAYWDSDCTNMTKLIDWGTVWPGLLKNITVYIKNVSNIETTLNFSVVDFSPTAFSQYLNVYWNYNGKILDSGEVIQVTIFLDISANSSLRYYLANSEVTDFSVDLYITVSDQTDYPVL